ncbi:glycosyltransferase family 2 protein [Pseudomonas sp. NMI795_08]|uniref:glycosyltransferase family 2 protein n=1 Tax=Pseudomonas sp. NMI795_08 TaxID=2903144 RepID=UPI001E4F8B4C|nr:glycosyltransferase family 2 protein [Pseudomonas sp. NMI795_08]MCE1119015.1 glycosyltransferase family 2 protein [Pseudomonas sp. NMI795_08]
MDNEPLIAILLCTYNGSEYLREQFDSFIGQTHKNWVVYASDDGSTDGTLDILQEYQQDLGARLIILQGPRQGFAANFISLIRHPAVEGSYFAFSDQDDIWMADKLTRGLETLQSQNHDAAALYCSRTQLIDSKGKNLGFSPLFSKPPSFRNALVQSLAGGNTMLINQQARTLLSVTPADARIVAHDWFTYLIVSSYQGVIVYDPKPTILYRQHGNNLIGSNTGLRHRLIRLACALHGRFSEWTDMNLSTLLPHKPHLGSENLQVLEQFELARKSPLLKRLRLLNKAQVYRQTLAGNLSLAAAAILNKL